MKSRTLVEEVERRRGDYPDACGLHLAAIPLWSISKALDEGGPATSEMCQFVPVRVVACMEGGLKTALAALVNQGDPFLSRAREIAHNRLPLNFDMLAAVVTDRVSFGELVSHALTWHDLEKINAIFSTILGGRSFFESLGAARDRWQEHATGASAPIITDFDSVKARLTDAIQLRNAICHEVAAFKVIDLAQARAILEAGRQFLRASAWVISDALFPDAPLTQADMTAAAWRDADAVDASVDDVIQRLLSDADPDDAALLSNAVDHWRQFRSAFAEFEGNAAKGGSLAPQLQGMATARLGRRLLTELEAAHQTRRMQEPAAWRARY